MVLPILIALVSAPALLGTQEAIRQSQSKEKREEHRARRCNLIASCVKSSLRSREINDRPIVLRDGKIWIDTGTSDGNPYGHPYAGYYLPYPDSKHEGLVTTITDVAPIMNWVYIDKETYQVRYSVRLDAQPNFTGPFDCTRQDRRLTFDGWEGWCAVEEAPGRWALYFDRDDDGLKSKVGAGTRVLEIELTRKEKRWKKDEEEREADQTTKRAVKTKEGAPVDKPATAQPELRPPVVEVTEEEKPPPLRPFGLPKSIFSDPPRPLFWGEERGAPMEPPPAYSQEEVEEAPVDGIVLPPVSAPEPNPEPERPLPPIASRAGEERPETPPQRSQKVSFPERKYRESAFETPRPAPVPPVETKPIAPDPLKVSPPTEKRPTPKLNRTSGTRAMSQAQMFEAWATGQTPKNKSTFKRLEARPTSNGTTVSNYSDPPNFDEEEILQMYGELKAWRPVLSEEKKIEEKSGVPFEVSDPAVFARLSSGSSTTYDPAVVKKKVVEQESVRRKKPAKEPFPRSTPQNPTTRDSTSGRNRDTFPDQPQKPSAGTSRDPPRRVQQAIKPTPSRKSPISRDRSRPLSSQAKGGETTRSSPIPPPRIDLPLRRGERPSPRPPARTNTAPVRNAPDRSRTTSGLFREIDDIVSTSRDRSGSATSNASGTVRSGSRSEDRAPPLKRTVTAREPRRTEGARGNARKGEKKPERWY
ncbi:hypothetical protein PMIN07_012410 [Paraphaeosphaeria minitans]